MVCSQTVAPFFVSLDFFYPLETEKWVRKYFSFIGETDGKTEDLRRGLIRGTFDILEIFEFFILRVNRLSRHSCLYASLI